MCACGDPCFTPEFCLNVAGYALCLPKDKVFIRILEFSWFLRFVCIWYADKVSDVGYSFYPAWGGKSILKSSKINVPFDVDMLKGLQLS